MLSSVKIIYYLPIPTQLLSLKNTKYYFYNLKLF